MTVPEANPIVSTLICHRDVELGVACLGSLARHSCEPVRFQLHDDGSLTDEDRERLAAQLPVHRFVSRKEADRIVKERLATYPYCAQFRRRYVYGLKLFDAPLLAPGDDLAFCDSDLFFLRPFRGLFTWPDDATGCLFMRDYQNAFAFRPWHLALQWKFRMPARLNCGLFYFRRRHYDLDFIEALLSRYRRLFEVRHHWVEQTCWGAMAFDCGGRFWRESQVCVVQNDASLSGDLIGAHLVTPVRGLLPQLLARPSTECAPEPFLSDPMPRLTAPSLLREQAALYLQRKWGRAS
jgi:hypothetical protein